MARAHRHTGTHFPFPCPCRHGACSAQGHPLYSVRRAHRVEWRTQRRPVLAARLGLPTQRPVLAVLLA